MGPATGLHSELGKRRKLGPVTLSPFQLQFSDCVIQCYVGLRDMQDGGQQHKGMSQELWALESGRTHPSCCFASKYLK